MKVRIGPEERLLVYCGRPDFDRRAREQCRALLRQPLSEPTFLALSRRHKVLPTVVENLRSLLADGPAPAASRIVAALADDYERRRDWIAHVVEPELKVLSDALNAAGVEHAFTKGAHLLGLYSGTHLRQLNDVDVLARDVTHLSRAYDVLHKLGYCLWFKYENPWLAGRSDDGVMSAMSGHFVFTRFLTDDPHTRTDDLNRVQVEIYTAGQTAGIGHLQSEIWTRLVRDHRGLTVPSPEDALLILVAHNVKHGEYFLKDVNDINLLAERHGPDLNWDYLVATARRNGLDAMAAALFHVVNEYHGIAVFGPATLDRLAGGRLTTAVTAASFRLRNHAQLSSATLQAPMLWAKHRGRGRVHAAAGLARELTAFVAGLPLEFQDTRLAPLAERLWRGVDRRSFPARDLSERTYLVPIACLPTRELDVTRLPEARCLHRFRTRSLLPGQLFYLEGDGRRMVLGRDYAYLPTVIPYKPSRAILRGPVEDHIALYRTLVSELDGEGLLRVRKDAFAWYPAQTPFAAV